MYINFPKPNNISLLLNISKRELTKAKELYNVWEGKLSKRKTAFLNDDAIAEVYNYLESVNKSVIFAYSAVEAFSNVSIPKDYEYKSKNNKGIIEIWRKENIERHFKTSDKIDKLLPEILNTKALDNNTKAYL